MSKRFWKGKKRLAKKYLGRKLFNTLFKYGIPRVGDLTHDCDGFNHVISKVDVYYYNPCSYGIRKETIKAIMSVSIPEIITYYRSRYIYNGINEEFDKVVCACQGVCWQLPLSREHIEAWALSWTKDMKEQQASNGYTWYPARDTWAGIILSGGHIVDEKGLLIV